MMEAFHKTRWGMMDDQIKPLILDAVEIEDLERVQQLLEKLDHVDSPNINKCAILSEALMHAANQGRVNSTKFLLDHGAEDVIDMTNEYGNCPLIMAAIRSHRDIMSLLIKAGCTVNRTDMESRTALHWCAMNGDFEMSRELLESGCLPDVPDKIYGFTPLMQAARQGHTKIVELLLRYNCDVNRTDIHLETPLFDAVRNDNVECMRLLLAAGANMDHLNSKGSAPIHTAVMYNRVDALKLLIHHNCNIDLNGGVRMSYVGPRYSALECAVMETSEEPCKILVHAGASVKNLYSFLMMRTDSMFESGRTVSAWLREVLGDQPRTLKELTRISIRAFYGSTLLDIVHNLPVPKALQLYLCIPEIHPYSKEL